MSNIKYISVSFDIDEEVKGIDLTASQVNELDTIVSNDFSFDDAITYLDDAPYRLWVRPRDIRA